MTVMRFDLPYVAAIVDLAESPRMTTNLADVAHGDIRVGIPVFQPAK